MSDATGGFSVRRRMAELMALGLLTAASSLLVALATYRPGDPSWNTATALPARNALGLPGAIVADVLAQSTGIAAILPGLVLLCCAA